MRPISSSSSSDGDHSSTSLLDLNEPLEQHLRDEELEFLQDGEDAQQDFGEFVYRNLTELKKANTDIVQKLKDEGSSSEGSQSEDDSP
jgi:hypothetical protein